VSLEPASTADPPSPFSLVRQVCSATWQALTGKSCGGSGLSGQARPPRPGPNPATRVRHRPTRDFGSVARVPTSSTIDRAVDGPTAAGPPPVPVVTVAQPPPPGPQRHRLSGEETDASGRTGQTPDGWTPHGWTADGWTLDGWTADGRAPDSGRRPRVTGHRTAGQPDLGRRHRMGGHRMLDTPATDAVACLLAGSTTATTPDSRYRLDAPSGRRRLGEQATRTAQPQGRRGHPRCHRWVWPPPRLSAAGGAPPVQRRLGALLSSEKVGIESSARW
jgi:hypothetical protein